MTDFLSLDTGELRLAAYGGALVLFLLVSLGVLYLVLRQQDARGERHDPQLGLKTVLQFFYSVSMLILLAGLAVLADDLARTDAAFLSRQQRLGFALAFAGLLFACLYWLLLRLGTNDAQWPAARQMFAGWRLAIHSFVVLFAATVLLVELFKEPHLRGEAHRTCFAVLCIWAPSWLLHIVLVWWYGMKAEAPRPAVSWETE